MKKTILLLALFTASLCATAGADDVALLEIRFEDGTTRQAAIEFYEKDAPETVANFKKLAKKGFYKGCAFHRAIPTAIVQTGDPLSKKKDRTAVGTGGPGYTLAPEIHRRHTKGAVAAARIGDKVNPQRRSNGSQFYVCISPQPQLDGKYTVFGNVIRGLDVLESISNRSADTNDYPIERIILKKVSIIPREKLPAPAAAPKPGAATPEKKPLLQRLWPW
jgi:cyclophilin family peptidyl-prolyl cis-trans isomerase